MDSEHLQRMATFEQYNLQKFQSRQHFNVKRYPSFRHIVIKSGLDGDVVRKHPVTKRRLDEIEAALSNRAEGEQLYDMDTFCETCGADDRADTLLLCDGCDLGYHLECLVPALSAVPRTRFWVI
jgi:hypothetical protein